MNGSALLRRLFLPAARYAVAKGWGFQQASQALKTAFLDAARSEVRRGGGKETVSRLSVLTGLQRRDVTDRLEAPAPPDPPSPVARLIAAWAAADSAALERDAFDDLARSVSRDVHPRTLESSLAKLGLIDVDGETIRLTTQALVAPEDEATLLRYLAANLGDHGAAAVENAMASPEPGPHLDRSAHYDRLSPSSAQELESLARALGEEALLRLNERALALQRVDADEETRDRRVRFGVYFYQTEQER